MRSPQFARSAATCAFVLSLVAAGCAGGQTRGAGGATGTKGTASSTHGGQCSPKSFGDTVTGTKRVVQIDVPCPPERAEVGPERGVPAETLVTVEQDNGESGQAEVRFSGDQACSVVQRTQTKVARLRTRYPGSALFRLLSGKAYCSLLVGNVLLCGTATVEATPDSQQGFAQARFECDPDPVMNVAVYSGSVNVVLASGVSFLLGALDEASQFPQPDVHEAIFSTEEQNRFAEQARELGFKTGEPTPPTPTVQPPLNVSPPEIVWVADYTAAATEGAWLNEPTEYTYQWLRGCDSSGQGCTPIPGATGVEYRPRYPTDCNYLEVVVTASNEGGSTQATSGLFPLNCVE